MGNKGGSITSILTRFFLGFIKIHILYHASQSAVYGLWLIQELSRHGYRMSPGTLYPILHSLEHEGLLRSMPRLVDGKRRKYYRTTAKGKDTLRNAVDKVQELLGELQHA